MPRSLILASASPRRCQLLQSLGVDFTSRPADVDETALAGEDPAAYVERLALAKVSKVTHAGEAVLAADTIVVLDGRLLGKPANPDEARKMLRSLAGRRHQVLTGVAVCIVPAAPRVETCSTSVTIAPMSEREISWYVDTGEPLDKAGAYAIQGLGALFVTGIEGNYTNVVGLPIATVYRLLRDAGISLLDFRLRPD